MAPAATMREKNIHKAGPIRFVCQVKGFSIPTKTSLPSLRRPPVHCVRPTHIPRPVALSMLAQRKDSPSPSPSRRSSLSSKLSAFGAMFSRTLTTSDKASDYTLDEEYDSVSPMFSAAQSECSGAYLDAKMVVLGQVTKLEISDKEILSMNIPYLCLSLCLSETFSVP